MAMASVAIVGGGGHVGLPLSIVLAESGLKTYAFDISADVVETINSGTMPFIEKGATQKLQEVLRTGNLVVTTDPSCISSASYVVIVIGTPVDEYLSTNPNFVIKSILDLKPFFNSEQTIILRSTIFPGVTKKVIERLDKEFPGIKVAYCPERIVEGQALVELRTLPQIIGANNIESFESARRLFQHIGVESLHSSTETAEFAKLFTNVWRYIKFAAANQFWMMANDHGVDFEDVRRVMVYNYPRAEDLPHAGFSAGPCLFKDTMQLAAIVQHNFPLGHAAMMINEGTPGYLVQQLKKSFSLSGMTVGILGMSYKGNIDDIRSSLAYKLRKLLLFECKEVLISDPYVADDRIIELELIIQESDLLIIGAPHDDYKELLINKPLIDIWGITRYKVVI